MTPIRVATLGVAVLLVLAGCTAPYKYFSWSGLGIDVVYIGSSDPTDFEGEIPIK